MPLGFLRQAIFKCATSAILLSSSVNASALNNWTYHQENDRQTNLSFSFARSPMPRTDLYDDLRLDIVCKDKKLQLIIETEVLIASQGSAFEVGMQVDKQAPLKVMMHTFPDSKRKGYTEERAKEIVDAMLAGQSVFIRVNTMIRRVLSGEMALTDAATPINQVYADCGLTAASVSRTDYNLAKFNQDFNQLAAEQQRIVLDKLQSIMSGVR